MEIYQSYFLPRWPSCLRLPSSDLAYRFCYGNDDLKARLQLV